MAGGYRIPNIRQRIADFAVLLLVIVATAAGCSKQPTHVRIGYHEFPPYELLPMAAEDGFFGNIHVHAVEYASATQGQRAFRNGAVDVEAVTLDEALTIAQDVPDLRIIAVVDQSNGGDAILAREGIPSLSALRGKRVGVELTALGAYMLTRALQRAGMTMADVEVVYAQFDTHEQLFRNEGVDAVVTYEPARSHLLSTGATVLFDSARIPGEIIDVLITRAGFAEEHPEAISALVNGWLRAAEIQHRDTAAVSARVAERLGIATAEVENAYRLIPVAGIAENRRYLSGTAATMPAQIQRLGATMLAAHLLTSLADPSALIDVPAARRAIESAGP